ncbi:Glycine betaine/L-proline ABC superfamily ATP binding cassette transporter, substrate-binding protein [Nostocoides japonicum T1-X7]|uniref:Glycine betaine/L-proline ABC superfamily ATP binding cassette transporter, substrate-binding protein n=1 Tax=Nostocoides japonicum T1-X7 TaxID=1194083 RepID=A0A077M6H6_9MICO|nr:glycine betaine ABC transporter substrate-binding protein [Tetrasphaera japonica]CCH79764.1 Glycine betaine/L-proline ABC superfamily ATP binding cassette transporter, substrate-binding protein [Tetrasphaera japonica T1-X7]
MITPRLSLTVRWGVPVVAVAMLAAGCGSSDNSGGSGSGTAASKDVSIGMVPSWTDQSGTAYLVKNVLDANGYNVKITELSDNAPIYTALSRGDLDLMTSSWKDGLQKSYWATYGSKLEDLDVYYDGAKSFLAVPDYMSDVTSIEDLPGKAAEFNNTITGIEPGAGLTKVTKEDVMPGYGLDKKFKLQLSSTVAMLTALKQSIAAKKPIVITMWAPFWANSSFPIKPLADPKGLYGKPENLHVISRKGFTSDQPKVANMLKHFKLSQKQYESLENLIVNKYPKGEEAQAVAAWLKANPDFAPNLAQYLK